MIAIGQQQDGDIRPHHMPDERSGPRVRAARFHIQQHHMKILLAGMRIHRGIHRLRSVGHIGYLNANIAHRALHLPAEGLAAAHRQQAGDAVRLPEAGVAGFIRDS